MSVVTHETPASLRIQKARTTLLLDHPFFGPLLFRLKGQESRSIKTMATDGVSLHWSPEFVETLNAAALSGTLAHEVMHVQKRLHKGGSCRGDWVRAILIGAKASLTRRKDKSLLNILEDSGRIAIPAPASTKANTQGEVLTVAAIYRTKLAFAH